MGVANTGRNRSRLMSSSVSAGRCCIPASYPFPALPIAFTVSVLPRYRPPLWIPAFAGKTRGWAYSGFARILSGSRFNGLITCSIEPSRISHRLKMGTTLSAST